MVFRRQTKPGCCLAFLALSVLAAIAPAASAQTYTYEVRRQHIRGGTEGVLRISHEGISFGEHVKKSHNGKSKAEAYVWRYDEIQQLTVGASELRVLTYEDSRWRLGRDREYVFDRLPRDLATEVFPLLNRILDQRFVAALPDERAAEWKVRAKLDRGLTGTLGTLALTDEELIFDGGKPDESRSWRLRDLENVSTAGPLDLTVTTSEKSGLFRGGMRQFHFQLQQALSDDRYNKLWRRLNRSKGLTFLEPYAQASN